jgi:fatty acid desaturase
MHTNEDDGSDPDHWTNIGPAWSTPLRWATVDLAYVPFYLRRVAARPRREQIECALTALLLILAGVVLTLSGHLVDVLVYYILPTRLAVWFLGYAFDWLPHHGLEELTTDRYRATRNRIGRERLLTPLLLYQNYHLVHHLHPRIPFYRYIAAWRRDEDAYLTHDPALATPLGHELTVEEYRRLRS